MKAHSGAVDSSIILSSRPLRDLGSACSTAFDLRVGAVAAV